MSAVIARVEESLRAEHPTLRLHLHSSNAKAAGELQSGGFTFSVAILDVTRCNDLLAVIAGSLQGARVPLILICQKDHVEVIGRLGLSRFPLIPYTSIDDLFLANSPVQQELLRAVPQARIHEELIYEFWFPRETSTIWVVCPQVHNPGQYADRSSPDYTYLDNLGDTDSLLEIMVFLSQYYPTATIERFSARDLPGGHTSGNLVVIGGPGSPDDISNEICREIMNDIGSRVAYSPDCEEMTVTHEGGAAILKADYRTAQAGTNQPGLRRDQGYFARFPNPLNANGTVILINGIHTTGVLGAARAFSERREALRNFHSVLASGASLTSFECHFEVQVLNGHVKVPTVDQRNVLAIRGAKTPRGATSVPVRAHPQAASNHNSIRVLFIAGDRGGSQVNQLQIPNEYHEIQAALRSCEHRDILALANPILGATRRRLVEAYRERPAIIHFAGHGSDRRLSILEDHDVLANETSLDADQLAEILGTMEPRVRLCVLNACSSDTVARDLVERGAVDCAIGWPGKVTDSAAVAFSRALYGALGDARPLADAVRLAAQACEPGCKPVLMGTNTGPLIVDGGENR
jgi:hypothetical protein